MLVSVLYLVFVAACLFVCCSLNPPPPLWLSVLDDDLYTADDKLHLQEIATNFQKLFPPHPAAVPEACIFVFQQKKEFAQCCFECWWWCWQHRATSLSVTVTLQCDSHTAPLNCTKRAQNEQYF
jgi:hypothetical protein